MFPGERDRPPLRGNRSRLRPEMARVRFTQSAQTDLLEAGLFYLADGEGITVLRSLHHARDLQRIAF
jgi:plasmid stabilization system protein ParE